MRKILQRVGIVAWWLTLPALIIYMFGKPRTRALITAKGKVLVVKGWLGNGKWVLPGGGLRSGETPLDGVCREVLEETGLRLRPEQLKASFKDAYRNTGITFPCHYFAAELPDAVVLRPEIIEISEAAWLDAGSLDAHTANPDVLIALAHARGDSQGSAPTADRAA